MADIARLEQALRNADKAGDTYAAKRFAQEIRNAKGQSSKQQQMPAQNEGGFMQSADDFVRAAANGLTFGMADRFSGYMSGDGTQNERDKSDQARERSPVVSAVGEIGGSALGLGKIAAAGGTLTRLAPSAGRGIMGATGRAATSAADGVIANEAMNLGYGREFGENMGVAAVGGAAAPALAGALTRGASGVMGAFNRKPITMGVDELSDAAKQAYQRADDAGVVYTPQATNRLRDAAQSNLTDFGYHPDLQPGAKVAMGELDRLAGQPVTFKGMDTARKVAGNAFQPGNKSNNALTSRIVSGIDDLMANPQSGDVLMGNADEAGAAIKDARSLYARQRKLETVNELLERAGLRAGSTGSGGNVENATRQELRKLLTDKKLTRGLTKDELGAVRQVVMGTPTQNALRLIGKLSPQGNGLMLGLGGGATAFGGGAIAIPAMIAGIAAKKGAERMTTSGVKSLERLVASGGNKSAIQAPKNAAQRAIENNKQLLQRMLMASTLQQSGAQ